MRFVDKIRRLRAQRGWNQEQLAIRAGLSRATIYNVEAAKEVAEARAAGLYKLTGVQQQSGPGSAMQTPAISSLQHNPAAPAPTAPTAPQFT